MSLCRRHQPLNIMMRLTFSHEALCGTKNACYHIIPAVPRVRLVYTLLTLNLLFAWAEPLLEVPVQRLPIHVLGPPLAPARKEDLLRVRGEVTALKGLNDTLRTYNNGSV